MPQASIGAVVLAADGTPLRAFADVNGIWRYPIKLNAVSPLYLEALLGYEDRYFYYHFGVNPLSLIRAAWQWFSSGAIVSGGSTITMQVARIFTPHERSLSGKTEQILRALQLHWHYSRNDILNFYINHAPFGGTLIGVQAASHSYFGKSADKLTAAEAALLAVMPQAPSRYRPDRHPQRAIAARNKVLERLASSGIWSDKRVAEAQDERLHIKAISTPHSAALLARRLHQLLPQQSIIKTLIDYDLQQRLELLARTHAARLPHAVSMAILAIDVRDMSTLAYIGSADFFDNQRFGHVDMIQAERSPGSTLKPFLYGMAIERGLIHSQSLLSDVPLHLGDYHPQNFSRRFHGAISVSSALQQSLNAPAVDVLARLGSERFAARLRNGGMSLHIPGKQANLSIILGGVGTTMESLLAAFASLGRQGMMSPMRLQADDKIRSRRLLSASAAWVIRDILSQTSLPGQVVAELRTNRQGIAWKTGTSFGFRDAWALGLRANIAIGVWVGRPDGTPFPGSYGAVSAAPLLFEAFNRLPARYNSFQETYNKRPASVRAQNICWPLGIPEDKDHPEWCHKRLQAWIVDDMIPNTFTERNQPSHSLLQGLWVDKKTGLRVNAACRTAKQRKVIQIATWPTSLAMWQSNQIKSKYALPNWANDCQGDNNSNLRLINQPKTLNIQPAASGIPLFVLLPTTGEQGKRYWFINDVLHSVQEMNETQPWRYDFTSNGIYRIAVMDDTGAFDSLDINVFGMDE
ncbi:MAG: penicillin-binding protein 1C [Mariprofundales bacterium]